MDNYKYTWAKKHFSAILGKGVVIPKQSIAWTFGDVEIKVQYSKNRSWKIYVMLTKADDTCVVAKQCIDFEGFYSYHFRYKVYRGEEGLFGAMFNYLNEPKLEELAKSGEWEMALLIAKGQNII